MVSAVVWLSVLDNVPLRESLDESSTSRTIVVDLFVEPGLMGSAILGFGVSESYCLCRKVRFVAEGTVSNGLARGLGSGLGTPCVALVGGWKTDASSCVPCQSGSGGS